MVFWSKRSLDVVPDNSHLCIPIEALRIRNQNYSLSSSLLLNSSSTSSISSFSVKSKALLLNSNTGVLLGGGLLILGSETCSGWLSSLLGKIVSGSSCDFSGICLKSVFGIEEPVPVNWDYFIPRMQSLMNNQISGYTIGLQIMTLLDWPR